MGWFKKTQEEINEYWSEDSENYDNIIRDEMESFRVERWQNRILRNAPQKEILRILDIGCGPGFFTMILAAKGHRVTGIDGADGMLQCAGRNITRMGYEAEIRKMDCHYLEFPDDTFDLIVSRNVTHALRDHVQVYREWLRVLKSGGVLLIYDANWHLTMRPGELREQYLRDVEKCIRIYGSDFSGNTDPDYFMSEEYQLEGLPHRLGDIQRLD